MGWRIWPLCHCQGLCLWPPGFVFVSVKVFVYDLLFASVSAIDFPPTAITRTRCLEWWKMLSFLTWWLFSGGDGSRCSTTIGGCCLSSDHHYHPSAGIFIIFIFTIVLTLTGGGCRPKRSPCQVFQLLFQNNFFVWMSQQKFLFCVVCNCTSINLSSSKKDLTVQSWWKISRGYFHFLNGTLNFLFIFEMYMFVRQKTLGPKYFPWFSNLSGLCSFSPGPFCPLYY